MKIKHKGTVKGIFLNNKSGSMESTPVEYLELTFEGALGDKHAGFVRPSCVRTPWYDRGTIIRNCRQICATSDEELAEVAGEIGLKKIRPELIGSNLHVRGVQNFSRLPPGSRIFFSGGSVIKVEELNPACVQAGRSAVSQENGDEEMAVEFSETAMERRGIVCTVEVPGRLSAEESFEIRVPD